MTANSREISSENESLVPGKGNGSRKLQICQFRMNVTNIYSHSSINPFIPNAPFLCPLKTSEDHKVFRCFQGAEKECSGNE